MLADETETYATDILAWPGIRGKIVVICEGDGPTYPSGSPRSYRNQERFPDANFYRTCLPTSWRSRLPRFFNGGGRADSFALYNSLRNLHERAPERSYLDPDKLYLLIDLDLQSMECSDYPWATTEIIHEQLYRNGALNAKIADQHRIWVTALIHKEAYFLLPSMGRVLQQHRIECDGATLNLRDLHFRIADQIAPQPSAGHDRDLERHFAVAQDRFKRFDLDGLDLSAPAALSTSWRKAASALDVERYERLCRFLFSVTKAKPHWRRLRPHAELEWTRPEEQFREQIELSIAREISRLEPEAHPVAGFLNWLRQRHG